MNRRDFLKALGIVAPTTFLAGGLWRFSEWEPEPLPCDILTADYSEGLEVCRYQDFVVELLDYENLGDLAPLCSKDGLIYKLIEGP